MKLLKKKKSAVEQGDADARVELRLAEVLVQVDNVIEDIDTELTKVQVAHHELLKSRDQLRRVMEGATGG